MGPLTGTDETETFHRGKLPRDRQVEEEQEGRSQDEEDRRGGVGVRVDDWRGPSPDPTLVPRYEGGVRNFDQDELGEFWALRGVSSVYPLRRVRPTTPPALVQSSTVPRVLPTGSRWLLTSWPRLTSNMQIGRREGDC